MNVVDGYLQPSLSVNSLTATGYGKGIDFETRI